MEEDAGEHEEVAQDDRGAEGSGPEDAGPVRGLPSAGDEDLIRANFASEDWISRGDAQDRSFKGTPGRERTADTRASRTDPDATPMRWSGNARRLGYQTHYVVDGGKSRIILRASITVEAATIAASVRKGLSSTLADLYPTLLSPVANPPEVSL